MVAGVTESSASGRTRRSPLSEYSQFSHVYHFATQKVLNEIEFTVKFGIRNYPLMSTLEFLLQPAFLRTEILLVG